MRQSLDADSTQSLMRYRRYVISDVVLLLMLLTCAADKKSLVTTQLGELTYVYFLSTEPFIANTFSLFYLAIHSDIRQGIVQVACVCSFATMFVCLFVCLFVTFVTLSTAKTMGNHPNNHH